MSLERRDFSVNMKVTEAQAVALNEFFRQWNSLSSGGGSRFVAFYVDGDGTFHPKCEVNAEWNLSQWKEEAKRAYVDSDNDIIRYDADGVSAAIRHKKEKEYI